jgi:hypothetical protein
MLKKFLFWRRNMLVALRGNYSWIWMDEMAPRVSRMLAGGRLETEVSKLLETYGYCVMGQQGQGTGEEGFRCG